MENNLVKLVDATGKKVAGVAKEAGIPDGTLRSYYNGTRQIGRKHQPTLAKYFNVSIGYLMGIEEKESAPAEIDRSAAMVMDIFNRLTPEERLDFLAYGAELDRNHKAD